MRLHISMTHESENGELDSLYRWLSADPDVARQLELERGSDESRPGAMGADPVTISAVVSAGAAVISSVAALISAVASWRGTHPRGAAEVTISADLEAEPVTLSDQERRSPEELSQRLAGGATRAQGQP